jgi:hypothetical protein
VITTGDQPVAAGFAALQLAAAMAPTAPHVYPHIGTLVPSGNVVVVGAAVRLTWAEITPVPKIAATAKNAASLLLDLTSINRIAVSLTY